MEHNCKNHYVCNIIPSFVHESISKNGNETQKITAQRNLQAITQLSGMRKIETKIMQNLLLPLSFQLQRSVRDAGFTNTFSGTLKRIEGQPPTGDLKIDNVYELMGKVHDFYKDVVGIEALNGSRFVTSVNFRQFADFFYNNAAFTGSSFIYGDADPQIFKVLEQIDTIMYHEDGHQRVQLAGGLEYEKDTGAMNESLADTFGITLRHYHNNILPNEDDFFYIGEGIWADGINGKALRSMVNPGSAYDDQLVGKDPQPAHMDNYENLPVTEEKDLGGVHINSGIPNKAFADASKKINKKLWESTGLIWYVSMKRLPGKPRHTTFNDLANTTNFVAGLLFGTDSMEQQAVFDAWKGVGLEPIQITGPENVFNLIKS
jgi:Zn-dependent metalloprotease